MPNQFQPFDFTSVENFLQFLPKRERVIVDQLRDLVFECLPGCREKLTYNVPFYYKNKRICFIWPSSVPWGKTKNKGVQIGFCQGYLMNDELNYLEKGNRKQMYYKSYFSLKEVNMNIIRQYLFEADRVDANFLIS